MTATAGSSLRPVWAGVVGQPEAVERLEQMLSNGATGRSFLFAGPRGVGRHLAARALAAALLCPDGGCGSCRTCARIVDGRSVRHVDVTVIGPEGAQILVEQVRELRTVASRSPHEAPAKVLIVQQAETMNAAAANALLKVLEEPPRDAAFVLESERPEELPDTIRSRCLRIDFAPLPPGVVRSILLEREGMSEETAEWAARVGGDLATALGLAKDPEARARRERHLEIPSRIVRGGVPAIIEIADELIAEAQQRVAAKRAEQKAESEELRETIGEGRGTAGITTRLEARHKREARIEETIALDAALRDLSSFYRDCLVLAAGGSEANLVNRELVDRVARGANAVDPAWLSDAIVAIEERRRMLTRNVQPRLAIESVLAILQSPRPRR